MHYLSKTVVGLFICTLIIIPSQSSAQSIDEVRLTLLRQLVVLLQEKLTLLLEEEASVTRISSRATDTVSLGSYNTSASAVARITDDRSQDFFERVLELTPDEFVPLYDRFKVTNITGGDAAVLGMYDSRVGIDWEFRVDPAFLEAVTDQESIDELIVHEIAHLVGETDNLDYFGTDSCHEYFMQQGCLDDSTIYGRYIDTFWDDERLDATTAGYSANRLYRQYPGEFVSRYAATNPAEDFAESFAHFALYPNDRYGEVAQEKIDFFNRFSYTLELKDEILTAR